MSSAILTLPQLVIEANGTALAQEHLRTLSAVCVQQQLSQPTLCELTFLPADPGNLGVTHLLPGTTLRLLIVGSQEPLFVGQITAVEHRYTSVHGYELRVRGYDLLHQLRKRQSVRAHVQVTTRDLARELVSDLGLSVSAPEPGPLWPQLIQHRQSDLDLLQDSAERSGLYLTVRGTVLHLLTLQGIAGEAAVPLALGDSLLEARLELNADSIARTISATGWDSARLTTHTGQAATARTGRTASAQLTPARVGASATRHLVDENTLSDEHATSLAQAELDQRSAREITFWGMAQGDARLRPGTPVQVTGVADTLAGRYVLTSVTHTLDTQHGYIAELSSVPPAPRPRQHSSVGAPGVVTNIDDPEKQGRVRVSLPTYGDIETDWIPLLSAGAGPHKGLMVFPDKGDHVLVLLAHQDPGQGVVLGSLYTTEKPPDVGIEGGTVRRYTLLTPGGQRVHLDDGHNTLRLENSEGSYCELAPHTVRLHSAANLEIEAPGQHIVIRGQQIDFERG